MTPELEELHEVLARAQSVAVLTGAGVSTDSGIPDFQSKDQAWPFDEDRESLLSLQFFHRNPKLFWEAYRFAFKSDCSVSPSAAHKWIAALEQNRRVTVITQNVDKLHQAAGSTRVLEVHGNAREAHCPRCGYQCALSAVASEAVPRCSTCSKLLRPSTVLFGEQPKLFEQAQTELYVADAFLVIGTSLEVGPVNLLPAFAQEFTRQPLFWLNREPAPDFFELISYRPFDSQIIGSFENTLKKLPSSYQFNDVEEIVYE